MNDNGNEAGKYRKRTTSFGRRLDHLCKSMDDLGLVFLSYPDLPHVDVVNIKKAGIEWGNTYDSLEKLC